MPEPPATPPPPPSAPNPANRECKVYCAGGGRRILLSFALLLLLPFFVSLPVMLYQRLAHGLIEDAAGLAVFGIFFAALMALVTVHLVHALRARVEIGERAAKVCLPRHVGAIPTLRYAKGEIAYDQIAAVESRRELYGNVLAPVLVRGARVIGKDGRTLSLGYVNETETDATFPVVDMADEIARRAGIAVTDRGNVRRMLTKKMLGIAGGDADRLELSGDDIAGIERRHRRAVLALVAVLVLLLAGGIARDVLDADIDRGEQAASRTQEAAAPTARAAAQKKQ
jgi:hypothetical protein